VTSLLDAVCDRRTRVAALECAVIAHVRLNPGVIAGLQFRISSPAAVLLDAIASNPDAARFDLCGFVNLWLAPFEPDNVADELAALAERAAALSVDELGQLGALSSIIDLLDSEIAQQERAPQRRAA
jgi:hypothetical protein